MKPDGSIQRRQFIKTFVLTSIGTGLCDPGGDLFLAEMQAQEAGVFRADITVSPFTPLQSVNGSVRVKVTGMPTSFPQIIITRVSASLFHAVTSKCTHAGCTVNTFNGTSLNCPCHGSRYSADGTVIQGPALLPLERYNNTFDGVKFLNIQIPNLGYRVSDFQITSGSQVRLTFPTVSGVSYEVRYRATFNDAWTQVPFTTTPGGSPTQTAFAGNNSNVTVYVNRSIDAGFYSVIRY